MSADDRHKEAFEKVNGATLQLRELGYTATADEAAEALTQYEAMLEEAQRHDADTEEEYAAALDRAEEALRQLRDAWNAHMETCPQHAALPVLPSWDDLERWRDAPSGTASA